MELKEFIEETNKIERFYEKSLDEFQREQWYNNLRYLPINRYRQLIKEIYNRCKFMPKLADVMEINKEMPYNTERKEVEKVQCNLCNSDGVIKYIKKQENREYEFFARCKCQNGNKFIYDGTKLTDDKHKSKFYIPTLEQINLER